MTCSVRKPDGKVNNLALGSGDAFQILGSVIKINIGANRSEENDSILKPELNTTTSATRLQGKG